MCTYLKDKVFSTPPENIQELRQKIIDEFNTLQQRPEMIQRALRDTLVDPKLPYWFYSQRDVHSSTVNSQ
jgi:hypothetical protein